MSKIKSITGRDGYVVAKALYSSIKYTESLPPELRERSDCKDVKAILLATFPMFAEMFYRQDEAMEKFWKEQPTDALWREAAIKHFVPVELD